MSTKILAIDDSPTLRQFITRSLTQHAAGYEVITAHDGEQGLRLASSEAPGLILLDFVLPGMKGDDVCRNLAKSDETRNIPVVLMSSSTSEINRTAAECSNVVKSISKPFTPELLCATVGGIVRNLNEQQTRTASATDEPPQANSEKAVPRTAGAARLAFSGHSGNFHFHDVLLAIEQDRLTGALRVFVGVEPLNLYFDKGRAVVVGTKDLDLYLGTSRALMVKSVQDEQMASGCPAHLIMAARGTVGWNEALKSCRAADARLLAPLWTRPNIPFEFELLKELPDWLAKVVPFKGPVSEWALESLREVGEDSSSAHAWGEGSGVPAYTRSGYERIQHIPLNEEEVALASLVDSARPLAEIARQMNVPTGKAESILFRFMCLEIFDYWPASVLRQS